MSAPLQTFSHYPAWPMPVDVPAMVDGEHPCAYLPNRTARMRAFLAGQIDPEVYGAFMDAGFRRSGSIVYQPMCRGCRACMPIRVRVEQFTPNKSQRRCWKANQDLRVEIGKPEATGEKYDLYRRYLRDWHGDGVNDDTFDGFERFLYDSPVQTIEFTYRHTSGNLLACGICDLSDRWLSSVYFYFDPAWSRRRLGTYGALVELDYARARSMPHYYLGYWVEGCRSMEYKSAFRPAEVLYTDGQWRDFVAQPA